MSAIKRALEEHTAAAQAAILAAAGICRTCGFSHTESDCPRWAAQS